MNLKLYQTKNDFELRLDGKQIDDVTGYALSVSADEGKAELTIQLSVALEEVDVRLEP